MNFTRTGIPVSLQKEYKKRGNYPTKLRLKPTSLLMGHRFTQIPQIKRKNKKSVFVCEICVQNLVSSVKNFEVQGFHLAMSF